jgi:hypothetical protein
MAIPKNRLEVRYSLNSPVEDLFSVAQIHEPA